MNIVSFYNGDVKLMLLNILDNSKLITQNLIITLQSLNES